MSNITLILLLTLLSFSCQLYHCLMSYKVCNAYNNPKVANCLFGYEDECYECNDGYSLSNDRKSCINFAHCNYFDGDNKCIQCDYYYNLNSENQCVTDYCHYYDNNKKCLQCYPGFYIKDDVCTKIPIEHCLVGDEKTCTECEEYTTLDNNQCKVRENLINGCYYYNTDGTCNDCEVFYELNNNKCEYQSNLCKGFPTIEGCELCEDGYYISQRTYQCINYDGSKEQLSNKNKSETINFSYLFSLLLLIISC